MCPEKNIYINILHIYAVFEAIHCSRRHCLDKKSIIEKNGVMTIIDKSIFKGWLEKIKFTKEN